MAATAVSVKLTEEDKARLARLAKATRRSAHFHMREAVHLYLAETESRLALLDEAREAVRDYDETGLHLNQEDMRQWIASGLDDLPPWRK